MAFEGSCHCGKVTFSVAADMPTGGMDCNCSHCRAKGMLLSFFPRSAFTLKSGADAVKPYTFNTHKIEHQFCSACGTQPFAFGNNPADGTPLACVNLRCVTGLDLTKLKLQPFDGDNM
jgi:hypothetical protein